MAVEPGGWDNRTFRLGELLSVRLPSGPGYAAQVAKKQRWLPRLAPELTLPVPGGGKGLSGESRAAFREALGADRATWARGRGWALWKVLLELVQHLETNPAEAAAARRVIDDVLAERERAD